MHNNRPLLTRVLLACLPVALAPALVAPADGTRPLIRTALTPDGHLTIGTDILGEGHGNVRKRSNS